MTYYLVKILCCDRFNLNDGKLLAMSALAAVALTALLLEHCYFFATLVFENLGNYRSAFDGWRADFEIVARADQKNVSDGYCVASVSVLIAIHKQDIAFLNRKLPALCFNRRFHCSKRKEQKPFGEQEQVFS